MKLNKLLIKGSFILILSFGLFNFLHFLFQFAMVRILSIAEYGILASLFAIIYILLVFSESFQTILAKYSAKENENGKLKNLLKKSIGKSIKISLFFFIIYIVISIPLSFILKIKYFLLFINGFVIFVTFFLPITRGVMQGRGRFGALGSNMVIESSIKLILGILFVFIGWRIYGAIIGVLLGGIIAFGFSIMQLKDILKSSEKKVKIEGFYNYAKPAIILTSIIIVFYSLDVIIAKIIFDPEIAGSYAIASILGKIIFWGTLPISKAMFPISAEEAKSKKNSDNIFANAFSIVFIGIAILLLIFYLMPDFIINIFSGKRISEAASILFYVGIAFSFISIANLVLLNKLSRGKTKGYWLMAIFVALEIIVLSIFSKDLVQFSIAFISVSAAFLWGSIVLIKE